MMKKVFLINVTCAGGSTGRIVTGIYDELTLRGYTCMAAYGRGSAPAGYNAYRIGTDFDVNVHGAISRINDRHGFYSAAATRKLIKVMKDFGPDIVHLHNIHGYYIHVGILFKYLKESGVQVIWTLHDCWSFTGHCTHFEFVGCNKWLDGCEKCEQLREYPKSLLLDASKKNYRQKRSLFTSIDNMKIVTPSTWLKDVVARSYMGKYPSCVVPTGINLDVFKPTKSDIRSRYGLDGKFVVLGVANPWRERKGLFEFTKLSGLLPDDYRIVLIGLKDSQIKELPDSIIAIKRTESIEEMAQWYSAADVYANLTMEDTFPTTNIEALACGTPVLTYRAGGSPESVADGCGIVVERASLADIVAGLEAIKNGPDMSENCIRQAENYSLKKRFGEYYSKVYEPLEDCR